MSERIPLADYRDDVAALLAPLLRRERVTLDPGLVGRIAADDVRARVDVPSADNSQMDGFAVRTAELAAGGGSAPADGDRGQDAGDGECDVVLPLAAPIAAGDPPSALPAGHAAPIMTGAPIPHGADLVIPVEETAEQRFDGPSITLRPSSSEPGRFVRRAGSDTRSGDTVLRAGEPLTPARIAHLASCGVGQVEVTAPVRVIVLSTGSEVTAAGEQLPPGSAYDANGPGLAAALTAAGAQVVHRGAVPDDASALLDLLEDIAPSTDAELLITSGGVSAGAYEVIRHAAADERVRLTFPTVAMQPGGPQGIGDVQLAGGRRLAWLAFPGNPVSALLSCELFARPALGAPPRRRLRLPLRVEHPEASPPALDQFRRARILPSGEVRLIGGPSSHLLGGLARADALVLVPSGVAEVHDGDLLETLLIGEDTR